MGAQGLSFYRLLKNDCGKSLPGPSRLHSLASPPSPSVASVEISPCPFFLVCLQPGVPAFTVVQPEGPLAVLRDRAQQIGVSDWLAWRGGGVC